MLNLLKNSHSQFKESLLSRITNYCLSSKRFQSSDSIICKIIITGNMKSINTIERFTRVFDNSKWTDSHIAGPTATDLKSFLISIYKPFIKIFIFINILLVALLDEYYAMGFFRIQVKEFLWVIFTLISAFVSYIFSKVLLIKADIDTVSSQSTQYKITSTTTNKPVYFNEGLASALLTREIFRSTLPIHKTKSPNNNVYLKTYLNTQFMNPKNSNENFSVYNNIDSSYWLECKNMYKYSTLNNLTLNQSNISSDNLFNVLLQDSNFKFQNDMNKESIWIKKNSQLTPSNSRAVNNLSSILNHIGDSSTRSNAINSDYWYNLSSPSSNLTSSPKSNINIHDLLNQSYFLNSSNNYLSNKLTRSSLASSLAYQVTRYNMFGISTNTIYDTQANVKENSTTLNKNNPNYILNELLSRSLFFNISNLNLKIEDDTLHYLNLLSNDLNNSGVAYNSLANKELLSNTNLEIILKVLSSSSSSLSLSIYKNYDFSTPNFINYNEIKL